MPNLILSLAASLAVVLVCVAIANQLRRDRDRDRRPAPRHSLAAMPPTTPALQPEPEPKLVFDPLDERFTIEEVENFLADLEASRVAAVITISAPPAPDLDDTRELAAVV